MTGGKLIVTGRVFVKNTLTFTGNTTGGQIVALASANGCFGNSQAGAAPQTVAFTNGNSAGDFNAAFDKIKLGGNGGARR